MLLRSSLNIALSDLSSLWRIASFIKPNCFSVDEFSRRSSISSSILFRRAFTTCVYIIRCEVILWLIKMFLSQLNHILGLFTLKGGTQSVMEFWYYGNKESFSVSIVNVLLYMCLKNWLSSKTCAGDEKLCFQILCWTVVAGFAKNLCWESKNYLWYYCHCVVVERSPLYMV